MLQILSILLGLFILLCLAAQPLVRERARKRLRARHREAWLGVEHSPMIHTEPARWFTTGDRHKALNDPVLDRHVGQLKLLRIAPAIACLGFVAVFSMMQNR